MPDIISHIKSSGGDVDATVSDMLSIYSSLNTQQMANAAILYDHSELATDWESGRFDADTGIPVDSSTQFRTSDYIGTSAFDTLLVKANSNFVLIVWRYEKNGGFIGYDQYNYMTGVNSNDYMGVPLSNSLTKLSVVITNGFPDSADDVSSSISFKMTNMTLRMNKLAQLMSAGSCDLFDLLYTDGPVVGMYDVSTGEPTYSSAQMRTHKIYGLNGALVKAEILDSNTNYDNLVVQWMYTIEGTYLGYEINHVQPGVPAYFRVKCDVVAFSFDVRDKKVTDYLKVTVMNSPKVGNGIKYSILGDSLSTFNGLSVGDNAFYPRAGLTEESDTWWRKFESLTGMQLDTNNSLSSSCVAGTSSIYTPMNDDSRLSNLGDPDVVIVEGGTNDVYSNIPSGEWAGYEVEDQDVSNFTQALTKVISYIQKNYKARVVYLSPTFIYEGQSGRENCTVENIDRICSIGRDVCDKMGAVFVDLRKCGLTKYNFTNFTVDGLHWNRFLTSAIAYGVYRAIE